MHEVIRFPVRIPENLNPFEIKQLIPTLITLDSTSLNEYFLKIKEKKSNGLLKKVFKEMDVSDCLKLIGKWDEAHLIQLCEGVLPDLLKKPSSVAQAFLKKLTPQGLTLVFSRFDQKDCFHLLFRFQNYDNCMSFIEKIQLYPIFPLQTVYSFLLPEIKKNNLFSGFEKNNLDRALRTDYFLFRDAHLSRLFEPDPFIALLRIRLKKITQIEEALCLIKIISTALRDCKDGKTEQLLKSIQCEIYFLLATHRKGWVISEDKSKIKISYREKAHQMLLTLEPHPEIFNLSHLLMFGESLTVCYGSPYRIAIDHILAGKMPSCSLSSLDDSLIRLDCHQLIRKSMQYLISALQCTVDAQEGSTERHIFESASTLFLPYLGLDDNKKNKSSLVDWLQKTSTQKNKVELVKKDNKDNKDNKDKKEEESVAPILEGKEDQATLALIQEKWDELEIRSHRLKEAGWPHFSNCCIWAKCCIDDPFLGKKDPLENYWVPFVTLKYQLEMAIGLDHRTFIEQLSKQMKELIQVEMARATQSDAHTPFQPFYLRMLRNLLQLVILLNNESLDIEVKEEKQSKRREYRTDESFLLPDTLSKKGMQQKIPDWQFTERDVGILADLISATDVQGLREIFGDDYEPHSLPLHALFSGIKYIKVKEKLIKALEDKSLLALFKQKNLQGKSLAREVFKFFPPQVGRLLIDKFSPENLSEFFQIKDKDGGSPGQDFFSFSPAELSHDLIMRLRSTDLLNISRLTPISRLLHEGFECCQWAIVEKLTSEELLEFGEMRDEKEIPLARFIFSNNHFEQIELWIAKLNPEDLVKMSLIKDENEYPILISIRNEAILEALINRLPLSLLVKLCQEKYGHSITGGTPVAFTLLSHYRAPLCVAIIDRLPSEIVTELVLMEMKGGRNRMPLLSAVKNVAVCQALIHKMPTEILCEKVYSLLVNLFSNLHLSQIDRAILQNTLSPYMLLKDPENGMLRQPEELVEFISQKTHTCSHEGDARFLFQQIETILKNCLEILGKRKFFLEALLIKLGRFIHDGAENDGNNGKNGWPKESKEVKEKGFSYLEKAQKIFLVIPTSDILKLAVEYKELRVDLLQMGIDILHRVAPYYQGLNGKRMGDKPFRSLFHLFAFCENVHEIYTKSLQLLSTLMIQGDNSLFTQKTFEIAKTYLVGSPERIKGKKSDSVLMETQDKIFFIQDHVNPFIKRSQQLKAMGWHHFSQIVTSHWYTFISNTEDHSFIEIVLVLKFHFEMKVGRKDLVSAQEIAHQLENHLTDEINRENQKSTLAPYLLALKKLRQSLQTTRQKLNPSERSFSFFAKTSGECKFIKREAYLLEVLQDTLEEVKREDRPEEKKYSRDEVPLLSVRKGRERGSFYEEVNIEEVTKEVIKLQKSSTTVYQKMVLGLGVKILELDENSKGCCTSNLTRQILRKKRDGLLRLYPKIKQLQNGNPNLRQLEDLVDSLHSLARNKNINVFCYWFGVTDSPLFSCKEETDTLMLIHHTARTIHSQIRKMR